jgi:hypothetical protein
MKKPFLAWVGDQGDNHRPDHSLVPLPPVGAENFILVTRPGDIH